MSEHINEVRKAAHTHHPSATISTAHSSGAEVVSGPAGVSVTVSSRPTRTPLHS